MFPVFKFDAKINIFLIQRIKRLSGNRATASKILMQLHRKKTQKRQNPLLNFALLFTIQLCQA